MEPDAVRLGLGKEGIVRAGYPVGQRRQAIPVGSNRGRCRVEEPWDDRLPRARVLDVPTARLPHDLVAVELMQIEAILAVVVDDVVANASEEGSEAVVAILGPLIEGMIVALGTL